LYKEIPAAYCAKEAVTDKIDMTPSHTLSVKGIEDPVRSVVLCCMRRWKFSVSGVEAQDISICELFINRVTPWTDLNSHSFSCE
jgi:hypothetical protein